MSKLQDYIEKTIDNRGKNPNKYFEKEKYPVIDNFLIQNNFHPNIEECARYIDKELFDTFLRDYVKKDEVIMTLVGNGIGNVALVPNDDVAIIQNTIGFKTKDNLDDIFLYYYFQFINQNIRALDRGSSQPSIKKTDILELDVNIPSIDLQKLIGKTLYLIDSKIENNNRINAELESMAKTIYDYWFTQFDFPVENGKPYRSSGGAMVWNEELKREIPKGWKITTLSDYVEFERGISYTSKDIESSKGIPMINLASVDINRNYKPSGIKYYSGEYKESKITSYKDMLIACTDLTRNADIIGSPILVPNDSDSYLYSMDLAKINIDMNIFNNLYMYMTLRTESYHQYIKGFASGTNVLHLNLDGIKWYSIFIPPLELQNKYAMHLDSIVAKKNQIINENQQLASLRDWLLPMLMNGQVGFEGVE